MATTTFRKLNAAELDRLRTKVRTGLEKRIAERRSLPPTPIRPEDWDALPEIEALLAAAAEDPYEWS